MVEFHFNMNLYKWKKVTKLLGILNFFLTEISHKFTVSYKWRFYCWVGYPLSKLVGVEID